MSNIIKGFLLFILVTILIPVYILIKLGELIIEIFKQMIEAISDWTDDMILFWEKIFKIRSDFMNKQLDIDSLTDETIYYEDIEIGDYVRFIDYGYLEAGQDKIVKIGQVQAKYSDLLEVKLNNNLSMIVKCSAREILKYNKDFRKILEEGDYIIYKMNELSFLKLGQIKKYKDARGLDEYLGVEEFKIENLNIKQVLTKEYFEAISFRLGE